LRQPIFAPASKAAKSAKKAKVFGSIWLKRPANQFGSTWFKMSAEQYKNGSQQWNCVHLFIKITLR